MHTLPLVVAQSFIYHELIVMFEISLSSLLNYMEIIEAGYIQRNTYHDSVHAADVTQGVHVRNFNYEYLEILSRPPHNPIRERRRIR